MRSTLIAATVRAHIDFADPPTGAIGRSAAGSSGSPNAVLPLYTRAADKVEAATAVLVGQVVDLTG
ncbi:MAG: hypothetical protein KDA22_16380 [Phycisphaerales bacterium]|nr:hypothetical protein [Phycisphaerales bacterium]